jgi:ADP-ribosylation factor-like protein 13B
MNRQTYNICVLGLDGAGKTTAIRRINKQEGHPPSGSSWGFTATAVSFTFERSVDFLCVKIPFKHTRILNFFDLGGHIKFRNIWSEYYADCFGLIYVINTKATERIEEAKNALQAIAADPRMQGKPMLILANGASRNELSSLSRTLALEELIPKGLTSTRDNLICMKDCMLTETSKSLDDGSYRLNVGVDWLIRAIEVNHGRLIQRVSHDTAAQKTEWDDQKKKLKSSKIHPI